jgi:CRP/FNR family transcriptional regulator, cyclic AMP receptor protein
MPIASQPADALSIRHESRFKVTGKRPIVVTGVIWLEKRAPRPLEEIKMKPEIAQPNQNTSDRCCASGRDPTYRVEEMSLKREYEMLRRVPIFAGIEPAKLKLLAFMCERVGFDPGNRLMQQGDAADAAYLIVDGHAEVILETPSGPLIMATVGANEIVGEVGILGNAPRAATVRAKDRLTALRIPKEAFMRMVRECPTIAVSIMQELAQRLHRSNGV